MLQAWATGSGRQVYCYQAGIIQKQHKKLDASIKNQVKCRHISKSYLSAHASIIQLHISKQRSDTYRSRWTMCTGVRGWDAGGVWG